MVLGFVCVCVCRKGSVLLGYCTTGKIIVMGIAELKILIKSNLEINIKY